jgi:hypothetical protein
MESLMDELVLPYRTDWREMSRVLDYCKGKGVERTVLDARFGGGESLRETLNALEQLGLILRSEAGDVRLTPAGDRLAYATSEAEGRLLLVEVMLRYWPYRVPMERAVDNRLTVLDAPTVERIWQVDMRLAQPRNRVEEARTFFFRLADDAGLGTYRRGVRGQTTRLELADDFPHTVSKVLETLQEHTPEAEPHVMAAPTVPQPEAMESQVEFEVSTPARITPPGHATRPQPTLSIQVDMSDWELDKIEAFLTMIGYLEEP